MNRNVVNILILLVFFVISCENKIEKETVEPDEDVSSDSDQIDDADETDDSDEEEPVSGLKIEANDKNVLSCRLSFSTPEEKKTFVKYYSASHSGYKTGEDSAKTKHYFFLWGMRENLEYKIEIYDEETGELLATAEFHSGIIPDYIHKPVLVTNEKKYVQPGFLLFSQTTENDEPQIPLILMVDTDGFIVWYYLHEIAGVAYLDDPEFIEKTKTVFTGVH